MTAEVSPSEARTVVLGPGEGTPIFSLVGGSITFKARGPETGGSLMAIESAIPPGQGPPLHVHATMDEIIYVLEGTMRVRLGAELHPAPAGTFVFIPRGVVHTWQNIGEEPARFFAVTTPAGLEHFFERMAATGAQTGDMAAFAAIGSEADVTVVGPPLGQSHGSSSDI